MVLAIAGGSASAQTSGPVLSSHGIGSVRFGTVETRAIEQLSTALGRPSARFVSTGCGFTEVQWSHLYVEFRRGRMSGFRYMRSAWSDRRVPPGYRRELRPRLTTTDGITLGNTLRQLRRRAGSLQLVGTDRWQSRDELIFYVSFSTPQPPAPSSRIDEVKVGTCGDW